jgi:hypothetical protein
MFSKSRSTSPARRPTRDAPKPAEGIAPKTSTDFAPSAPKAKPPAVDPVLGPDDRRQPPTTGDIQIEGTVEGDIRAHLLTVGEGATVKGEIVADDVVINGRIVGRVRGLKVRLTSTARVEGDIIHKTIAIEAARISKARCSVRKTRCRRRRRVAAPAPSVKPRGRRRKAPEVFPATNPEGAARSPAAPFVSASQTGS